MRKLPYPAWLLLLLRPLRNRFTWKLRLRILLLMNPPWFNQPPVKGLHKQRRET